MRVLFGELRSDDAALIRGMEGGLQNANNCVPYPSGYGPFLEPVDYSAAAPSAIYGAVSTKDISGNVYTFAGTATDLYKSSSTALDEVTRLSGDYTKAASNQWEFATFGNTFLAVDGADAMQVYTLGTSSNFINQSASASCPVAAHIAVVRDFVMVGDITNAKNRVQWCQINNPVRWTISQQNQADYQDLPGSGQNVMKITGGDNAHIFTEGSVWLGSYVGSPLIFRFDEVAPGVRCLAGGSVARYQNVSYFLSSSGFMAFDGVAAQPIGVGKVDRTVTNLINKSYLHRVSSTIDPVNQYYMMLYPTTDSADGTPDKMEIYHWPTGRWTTVSQGAEYLFNHMTSGYTLEGLDALGNMETLPNSLDSPLYQGGVLGVGIFTTGHKIARFEGAAKDALFITGESQLVPDSRAFVTNLTPLVDYGSGYLTTVTVRMVTRDRQIDDVTLGPTSTMNSIGQCPLRSNARYHRCRMRIQGGFGHALGFDVDFRRDGKR